MDANEFIKKYNDEHEKLELSATFKGPIRIDKAGSIIHPWELVDCSDNVEIAYNAGIEEGYRRAEKEYIDSDTFDEEFK